MGFLDKAKQTVEQARQAGEQLAHSANDKVADVQTQRELQKAYGEFGEKAYALADSGAISHPDLEPEVARIRELKAKLAETQAREAEAGDPAAAPAAEPTESVEQPLSGAETPTS